MAVDGLDDVRLGRIVPELPPQRDDVSHDARSRTVALSESVVLGMAGGLLGGSLARTILDGPHTTTLNWQSYTQVAFAFAVTPRLLAEGVLYAVAMGLLGGLFPAVRAAQVPVAAGLRGS